MTYARGTKERLPSGKIRARVPDGAGKYRSLGTYDTEEEADRMLDAAALVRNECHIGQTVADYGEIVIQRWKLSGKRSTKDDFSRWKKLVVAKAEWAKDPIDAVNRGEVRAWARSLVKLRSARGKPYGAQTIKHALNLVRRVFAEAVDDELIVVNPAAGVKPPRGTKAQDAWTSLNPLEIGRLLRCAGLSFEQRTVFAVAIYTGLRQGELAALRWPDVVDLDGTAPHIIVSKSWSDETTKTDKARRVDLIPLAVHVLKSWRDHARGTASASVWGQTYARGYDWGWADHVDLTRGICWLAARRKAGISRRVVFHHLRDTCASNLLTGSWGRAWTIAEVATLLGHSTTWVTERYARILPGAMAKAAKETSHESPTPDPSKVAQVRRIVGRAMQGSNLQPSAPEADAHATIPTTYHDHGRFVEGSARKWLNRVAAGEPATELDALELAGAVLASPEVQLAAAVVDGGPHQIARATELAGMLADRLPSPTKNEVGT